MCSRLALAGQLIEELTDRGDGDGNGNGNGNPYRWTDSRYEDQSPSGRESGYGEGPIPPVHLGTSFPDLDV